MKVSKDFILQEFVPEVLWKYKVDSCIWFMDQRLISLVQFFRDHFNRPIIVNNWHSGGTLHDCGFRMPDSRTGAVLSQHKFGRAADIHFDTDTDYGTVRQVIKDNWAVFKEAGLTTIEADTPTWLHIDIRHTGMDELLIVPYR